MQKNAQPRVNPNPLANVTKVPLGQAIAQLKPQGMTPQQADATGIMHQFGLNQNAPLIVGKPRPRG